MGSAWNEARIADQDYRSECDIERAWRRLEPATVEETVRRQDALHRINRDRRIHS